MLADVTFRLHGLPAASVAVQTPESSIVDAERVIAGYGASQLEPSALELQLVLPAASGSVTALFEGDEATARLHANAAAAMVGDSQVVEWSDPGHPWRDDAFGVRIAFPPAVLGDVLRAYHLDFGPAAVTARAGVGVLELSAAPDARIVAGLRDALAPLGATVVVVAAPPDLKRELDVWGPTPGLSLMRSIKDQFDPGHRLAPGRFVGGI